MLVLKFLKIDHIGLIVRFENGEIFVLESLGKTGVSFYRWTDFIKEKWTSDYERMLYRKLHCNRSKELIDELEKYIKVI